MQSAPAVRGELCFLLEFQSPPPPKHPLSLTVIINNCAQQTDSCCYGDRVKKWREKQSSACQQLNYD